MRLFSTSTTFTSSTVRNCILTLQRLCMEKRQAGKLLQLWIKLSCIRGEKSQHSSLCHLTIQRSIKRSARPRPIWQLQFFPPLPPPPPPVDATIINLIRNLSIVHLSLCSPLSRSNTHKTSIQAESGDHAASQPHRSWPEVGRGGGALVKAITLK